MNLLLNQSKLGSVRIDSFQVCGLKEFVHDFNFILQDRRRLRKAYIVPSNALATIDTILIFTIIAVLSLMKSVPLVERAILAKRSRIATTYTSS